MFPYIEFASSVSVAAWNLSIALACLVTLAAGLFEARHRNLGPSLILQTWPWAVLGGFIGAHLYWLAFVSPKPFFQHGFAEFIKVYRGTTAQGAILGVFVGTVLFLRLKGQRVGPVLDVLAPGGALAHAIGRVGCFAQGCCYGRQAPLWLGFIHSHPKSRAPLGVPLHAAQLYESVLDLGLAAFLHFKLKNSREAPGAVFWYYVGGYSLIRFLVQFFRGDDLHTLRLGLAHSQYTALVLLAAAGWMIFRPSARR